MGISAVRFARHTSKLNQVVAFYRDGVGLEVIASFEDHQGYSGVILGLPGSSHHLEFTSDQAGTPAALPTADDLVAFYFHTVEALEKVAQRLRKQAELATPSNPYWRTEEKTVGFLDPDGWRVVLVHPPAVTG